MGGVVLEVAVREALGVREGTCGSTGALRAIPWGREALVGHLRGSTGSLWGAGLDGNCSCMRGAVAAGDGARGVTGAGVPTLIALCAYRDA